MGDLSDSQKWLVLAFLIGASALIYLLSPVLMPFAVAAVLAYLGDPLVDRLEALDFKGRSLSRTVAVVLVFSGISLAIAALLIVVIPALEYQIGEFIDKLPAYLNWLNRTVIPVLQKYLGRGVRPLHIEQLSTLIKNQWQDGGGVFENFMQSVSHSGAVIIGWLMNLVLIPVITFYLLRDWDVLVERVHDLFPRRYAATVGALAAEADDVLGAFLRGQFYVMLALGGIYSIGLWLVDLELALVIGMTAGLISFIPYMGALVGIVFSCIAALLQFQDAVHLLPVLMVFAVGQSLEGMVLTPWLVGNKIGLHPVAVMFAVMAGGRLFGFLGVLLALPVASVIMVLLRHLHERYTFSGFYSKG
ncbi:AI-2E family transporter [Methylomonas sp. MED-D]|uniref:AI-2E family transporter n=1 Tax=Methylomonas koyamae TaxID=702114 RepID=A0A177NH72_9GAMM|nr:MULTISPECIES: AI-2E family transporter [Methylomonas]MDT4329211.1 AI-2E family transporter [Methylomonas sp. MV1]NJA07974.1 AI-2E family transporter [Methylococcaceae bacterium WWC4]OAI16410.1 AI-2E family transporter [Methylomonas koyamae]OHX36855.1 AI-2E family transporter [Methylomonas sp. LWB]